MFYQENILPNNDLLLSDDESFVFPMPQRSAPFLWKGDEASSLSSRQKRLEEEKLEALKARRERKNNNRGRGRTEKTFKVWKYYSRYAYCCSPTMSSCWSGCRH